MAIRRRFASVPPVFVSTKTSRSRSYEAMPPRSARHLMAYPSSRADKLAYDSRAEDYLNNRVSNASFFSNYALEEGYDTARQSRNRDARLLRDATDAIQSPRSTTISSAGILFTPRRFPRRFGKPNARKDRSSSFYGTRLTREAGKIRAPSLPPLSSTAPSGDWRNYARHARARSASLAPRSRLEDDVMMTRRPSYRARAQSVGPSLFSPPSPSFVRGRSLPPPSSAAEAAVRESRRLLAMPVYSDYRSYYPEYEPSVRSLPPYRRQKVLVSRRPPGNYYERVLRKRGRVQGRQSTEYPETSVLDSDLTGALSRVGRANDYSGASLLLSIEGSGLSDEGKRVGFTYTPDPIPLFGRSMNESIYRSRFNLQPLDTFLSGHVARMEALRMQLDENLSKDKYRRLQFGLRPLESFGPRPVPTWIRKLPEPERPLVTTVMRRQPSGPSQRLDVIPLGSIKPRLSRSDAKSLKIPSNLTGGLNLSMLDKINIKAALIASKMDADPFKGRRPRSEYAARKYRSIRLADQENIYAKSPQTAGYYASHPPLPKMTERKAIRTDEGYTKPKNILSWQSTPTSGSKTLSKVVVRRPGSVMEQVVTIPYETAKKRSRFLKRASSAPPVKYFPSPYDFPDPRLNVPKRGTISPLPKQSAEDGAEGERQRATVKIPSYYAYGVDPANPPVSDLRKRIRKTLNKTRRSR